MRGAIPPCPSKPTWCGAQLKKGTETTLSLPLPLHVRVHNLCACARLQICNV
jgi:hypothetical protein